MSAALVARYPIQIPGCFSMYFQRNLGISLLVSELYRIFAARFHKITLDDAKLRKITLDDAKLRKITLERFRNEP